MCIPGQPRYSLYVCFADSSSSHAAYWVSIFVTILIIISCITFTLETMPAFRIEAEVYGRPNTVFDAIETFAIAVFTIEYFSRLLTYSAVPREEDADSKLLLFEARMLERRAQGVEDDEESEGNDSAWSGDDRAASREGDDHPAGRWSRPPNRAGHRLDSDSKHANPADEGSVPHAAELPPGRHRSATMPAPVLGAEPPATGYVETRRREAGHTSRVASAARVARGQAGAVADRQGRRSSLASAGAFVRQQGGAEAVKEARAGASKLASLRIGGAGSGSVLPTRSFPESTGPLALVGLQVRGGTPGAIEQRGSQTGSTQPSLGGASTSKAPAATATAVAATRLAGSMAVASTEDASGVGIVSGPAPAPRHVAGRDGLAGISPVNDVTAASAAVAATGELLAASHKQQKPRTMQTPPDTRQVNASAAAAAAGGVPAKGGSEGSTPPRGRATSTERPFAVGEAATEAASHAHVGGDTDRDGAVELRPVTSTRSNGMMPNRAAGSPSASDAIHRHPIMTRQHTGPASEGRKRQGHGHGFQTGAAEVAARQMSERTIGDSLNNSGSVPFQSVGGTPANDLPTPSRGSGLHRGIEDAHITPDGLAGPSQDHDQPMMGQEHRGLGATSQPPPLLLQHSGHSSGGRPVNEAEATAAVAAAMAGVSGVSFGAEGEGDVESLSTRHERQSPRALPGASQRTSRLAGGTNPAGTAAMQRPLLGDADGIGQSMMSVLEAEGGDAVGTLPTTGAGRFGHGAVGGAQPSRPGMGDSGQLAGGSFEGLAGLHTPGQTLHPDAAALLSAGGVEFEGALTGPPSLGNGRTGRMSASTASRPASRDGSGSRTSREGPPAGAEQMPRGIGLGGGKKFASWTSAANSRSKRALGTSNEVSNGHLRQTKSGKDFSHMVGRSKSRRVVIQELGDLSKKPQAGRSTRYIKPSKSVRMLSGSLQPGQITEFQRMRMLVGTEADSGSAKSPLPPAAAQSHVSTAGAGKSKVPGAAPKATPASGSSMSPPGGGFLDRKAINPATGGPIVVTAASTKPPGATVEHQEGVAADGTRRRNGMSIASGPRVAPEPPTSENSPMSQALQPFSGQGIRRQSELDMAELTRKASRTRRRPSDSCCAMFAFLPCCAQRQLTQFDSTWSLDEQATLQERKQLAELHTRAASDSFSRRIAHEVARAWEFVIKPLNVVDLLAIIPFYIGLLAAGTGGGGLTVFRILRLGRVFRIFKLGKSSGTLQLMAKVMLASADALSIIVFFILMGVILFGSLLWIAEGGEYNESLGYFVRPDEFGVELERTPFDSIPATAWFVVVTVTTTGFGDHTPNTWLGKLIAGVLAHVGILVLALPVTILGANFAYYYAEDEKEKEETERERIRAEEGFEDDLSDVYSQAGALDEVEVHGFSVGSAYDVDEDPSAPRPPGFGDDVPKYEQRHAAFYEVQAGGYVPALRTFIYNPYIKDDTFADGIAEALTTEVDQRVRDLHLDVATKVLRRRVAERNAAAEPTGDPQGRQPHTDGPVSPGGLPVNDSDPTSLSHAKVIRRRSVAAKARRNRRKSSATEALTGAGKTLGGLGRKGHLVQLEQNASRNASASAVASHAAHKRMSAGAMMTGAAAAASSGMTMPPLLVPVGPTEGSKSGSSPLKLDTALIAGSSAASQAQPVSPPVHRLHLAAPRRASVSGGTSGAAVGRMVSQRRMSNTHMQKPGERVSLLQDPHLEAAILRPSTDLRADGAGSEGGHDDASQGGSEGEDRVGFGPNIASRGVSSDLRTHHRSGSTSPRVRAISAVSRTHLKPSRGESSSRVMDHSGEFSGAMASRSLYGRVAAQNLELGQATARGRAGASRRGLQTGTGGGANGGAGGGGDNEAEFLNLLASGGSLGSSSGGAGGMSWQLKQVAKQVAREVRADGTAETIVAVREEQAELREALLETQSDLAAALKEMRKMATKMQDQQRARMIVARSSSVDSRLRLPPAAPPRSASPRSDASGASSRASGAAGVDVTKATPSDDGVDSVAQQLKQQLSRRQLRELLAKLESSPAAAADTHRDE